MQEAQETNWIHYCGMKLEMALINFQNHACGSDQLGKLREMIYEFEFEKALFENHKCFRSLSHKDHGCIHARYIIHIRIARWAY